jgi:hypothetical protein
VIDDVEYIYLLVLWVVLVNSPHRARVDSFLPSMAPGVVEDGELDPGPLGAQLVDPSRVFVPFMALWVPATSEAPAQPACRGSNLTPDARRGDPVRWTSWEGVQVAAGVLCVCLAS